MDHLARYSIIMFLMLLSACSAVNRLYDHNEYFEELRDAEVGQSIDELNRGVYSYNNNGYLDIIKKDIDAIHWEYPIDRGKCKYALLVDKKSRVVASWRYVENKELCTAKPFYEGAW